MTTLNPPYDYPQLAESIIQSIAAIAPAGDYIFRGENEYREEAVKSGLYREYENTPILSEIGIDGIQEAELAIARQHDGNATREEHLLHELQHHRGKTNLIDFSESCLIALFFACDGSPNTDGRLIFLERNTHNHIITKPTEPSNRVAAQQSIFVSPEAGYIPMSVFTQIPIPKEVKHPIIETLRIKHNITGPSIYNDLHGYVTRRELTHQTLGDVARGISFYNQGHYLQAIIAYDSAIRLQPENIAALLYSGMAHFHLNLYRETIDLTTKAIEVNPYMKEAYNLRGRAHAAENDHDTAIQDYGQAINIDRSYVEAFSNRGNSFYRLDKFPEAIADCNTAIDLDPQWAIPYVNRAAAHYYSGAPREALADLDRAIDLDPNLGAAYYARSQVRQELDLPGSDADLEKALSLGQIIQGD